MEHLRSQPVLLIAAGPGAVATLAQLPRVAQTLSVRVAGPLGTIVAKGPAGRIRTSNCFWLSEISVPEATHRDGVFAGEFDEASFQDICSLVRRLQAGGHETSGGRSRVRVHAYVIVDLTAPGVVAFVTQLVQVVRRADPSIEMTGLVLTERTVETSAAATSAWCETFDEMTADLEKTHLLQRLYILDGEDINRTWLANPEQMHRIGAEFILHHGLSPYRHHLRRREKTRTSLTENVLDFCGSMMCKRFHWDLSTVAREIAAAVANDVSLQQLDQGVLSQERSKALDDLVQNLTTGISTIYRREESPPSGNARHTVGTQNKKTLALLEQTLKDVCSETPVSSVQWFVSRLRPRLDELVTFSRLRARWDSRHRAGQDLRRQLQNTYMPIKKWQEHRDVQWQTPFRPSFKDAPSAILSHPIPIESYLTSMGIAAVGAIMIGLGRWLHQPGVTLGGGIVAIWATVVTALESRWTMQRRIVVLQDDETHPPVDESFYQARASAIRLAGAALFLAAAVGSFAWTLWGHRGWQLGAAILFGVPALVCGLAGAILVYVSGIRTQRPHGVPDDRQAPGLSPPRDRLWFLTGLTLLTLAWAALCQTIASSHVAFDRGLLAAALSAAWISLALAQFPRYGRIQLACTDLRKPATPAPVEARSVEIPHLTHCVERLRSWADRLTAVSESLRPQGLDWNHAGLEDPLPRMFSPHWQSELAKVFEAELETQTGKTLKQLVVDPANWARCLARALSDPSLDASGPLHVFCLYYVRQWLRDRPLERIIAKLTVDRDRLISAISTSAPPRWPPTRDAPEIDASVIAVGRELWDIIAPLANHDDPHRFVVMDWQEPFTVAVVRIVQGLSRGWQGRPGLPGQRQSTDDLAEASPWIQANGPVVDGRLRNVPVPDVRRMY